MYNEPKDSIFLLDARIYFCVYVKEYQDIDNISSLISRKIINHSSFTSETQKLSFKSETYQ